MIDNQQGPTVSTGNYTEHFIITYKGKESEYIYKYILIYLYIYSLYIFIKIYIKWLNILVYLTFII